MCLCIKGELNKFFGILFFALKWFVITWNEIKKKRDFSLLNITVYQIWKKCDLQMFCDDSESKKKMFSIQENCYVVTTGKVIVLIVWIENFAWDY